MKIDRKKLRTLELEIEENEDNSVWGDSNWPFLFEKKFNKIIPRSEVMWCIAGSAVRDYHLYRVPRKIDVYLLGKGDVSKYEGLEWRKINSDYVKSVAFTKVMGKKVVVHKMKNYPRESILTVKKVIDFFDVNVSRFGFFSGNFVHTEQDYYDLLNGVMKLENISKTQPEQHLKRMYRISMRYGFDVRHEDILKVSVAILKANDMMEEATDANVEKSVIRAEKNRHNKTLVKKKKILVKKKKTPTNDDEERKSKQTISDMIDELRRGRRRDDDRQIYPSPQPNAVPFVVTETGTVPNTVLRIAGDVWDTSSVITWGLDNG